MISTEQDQMKTFNKSEYEDYFDVNLLKVIMQNIFDYIYIKDIDSRFIKVNKKAAWALGCKHPSDAIGKSYFDFFPEIADNTRKDEIQIIKTGNSQINVPLKIKFADETIHWVSITKHPIINNDGRIIGIFEISRDITDIKQSTKKLSQFITFYEQILGSIKEGIWVTDKTDVIHFVNTAMGHIAGVKKIMITGKNVLTDFPEDTAKEFNKFYKKAKKTKKPVEYESRVVTPAGRETTQSGWLIPIIRNNEYDGMICSILDITEKKKTINELKQSNQLFQLTGNNLPKGIIHILDKKFRYIYNGGKILKDLNISNEMLIGKTIFDVLPKKQANFCAFHYRRVLKGETVSFEAEYKDRIFQINGVPLYDSLGNVNQILVLSIDISLEKKTERELKEREIKYRCLFENSNDPIVLTNEHGKIIDVNIKFLDLLGFERNEMIGQDVFLLHPNNERKKGRQYFQQVLQTNSSNFQSKLIKKNGSISIVEMSESFIEEQRIVQCIIHDVTKRVTIENALRSSEKKYRKLSENISEIIYSFDVKTKNILFINSSLKNFTGYTSNELKNINEILEKVVHPVDLKRVLDEYQTFKKTNKNSKSIFRLIKKDGTVRWIQNNFYWEKDDDKKTILCHGIIYDITSQKKAELNLKKSLLHFDIEEGNLYLIRENDSFFPLEIFNDLIDATYPGILISRTPKKRISSTLTESYQHYWLSDHNDTNKNTIKPTPKAITQIIKNAAQSEAILIDRLDYLINKNSFQDVLHLIQHLNELAYLKNHIIILSIDSETLNPEDLKKIDKECKQIKSHYSIIVSKQQKDLLSYILKQNKKGYNPCYTEIAKDSHISLPTARKKIKTLILHGLLKEIKNGRKKTVEITEKSMQMI